MEIFHSYNFSFGHRRCRPHRSSHDVITVDVFVHRGRFWYDNVQFYSFNYLFSSFHTLACWSFGYSRMKKSKCTPTTMINKLNEQHKTISQLCVHSLMKSNTTSGIRLCASQAIVSHNAFHLVFRGILFSSVFRCIMSVTQHKSCSWKRCLNERNGLSFECITRICICEYICVECFFRWWSECACDALLTKCFMASILLHPIFA